MSRPKYSPARTVLPLMQASTSPAKYGSLAYSQRTPSSTLSTADATAGSAGSTPRSASSASVHIVDVHACPDSFHSASEKSAGPHAPPSHEPSSHWSASSAAPHPSLATRERSAATASGGEPSRSLITCQRIAGSPSMSQSMTSI